MEPYDLLDRQYLASFSPVYAGTDRAGGDRPVRILNLQESPLGTNLNASWKSAIRPLHLNHRHVVSTYPPYQALGWIITERVAGHLGGEPSRKLKPDQARTLLRQMLEALEQYHSAGMVHGGVCPESFLIDDKRFAKLDYSPGLLFGGEVLPRIAHHEFTPPETINPALGAIGIQADLYSLGMSIAALLIGPDFKNYFPIDEQSPETARVSWQSWHARPGESLDSVGVLTKVPAPLREIIGAMTAKQVAARPASAGIILKQLEQVPDVLIDLPTVAPPAGPEIPLAPRLDQVDNSLVRRRESGQVGDVGAVKPKRNQVLLPAIVLATLTLFLAILAVTQYPRWMNRAPQAVPDANQITEAGGQSDVVAVGDAEGNVLTNDTDPDERDTKTVVDAQSGKQNSSPGQFGAPVKGEFGELLLKPDGTYRYTLDNKNEKVEALGGQEETLNDLFTYTLQDRRGKRSSTQLTLSIRGANDSPKAIADSDTAKEAGGVENQSAGRSNPAGKLLANDQDPDSADSLTVVGVQAGIADSCSGMVSSPVRGKFGAIQIEPDGSYTYSLDNANKEVQTLGPSSGKLSDIFTYTIRDRGGLESSAQLTVDIEGANDAPGSVQDELVVVVEENGSLVSGTPAQGNVLSNDSDPDNGDTLKLVGIQAGAQSTTSGELSKPVRGKYGSVSIQPDGVFGYTPDPDNSSVLELRAGDRPLNEVFSYTVKDQAGLESKGLLTISIQSKKPRAKWYANVPLELRTQVSIERDGQRLRLDAEGKIEIKPGERLRLSGPGYQDQELTVPEDLKPELPWKITPTPKLPEGYKAVPGKPLNPQTGYPEEIYFDDPELEKNSPLRLRLVGADVDEALSFEVGSPKPDQTLNELPRSKKKLTRPFYVSVREVTNYQTKRLEFLKDYVTELPDPNDFNLSPNRNIVFEAAQSRCSELFGGRLPTEAEWELAARGADKKAFPYPWGEGEKRVNLLVKNRNDAKILSQELRDQTALSEDISPYGIRNLFDGLAEWSIREDNQPVIRGCSINDEFSRNAKLSSNPNLRITRRQLPAQLGSNETKVMVSLRNNNSVFQIDAISGELNRKFSGHTEEVLDLSFNADATLTATGSRDKTVRVWDTATGTTKHVLRGHAAVVRSVAFSRVGSLLASSSEDGMVKIWEDATGDEKSSIQSSDKPVLAVAFGPDAKILATGGEDNLIKLWDVTSGKMIGKLNGHENAVTVLAFRPGVNQLLSGSLDRKLILWDVAKQQKIKTFEHGESVISGAISRDGKFMASGGMDSKVRLWDLDKGEMIRQLDTHSNWVTAVAFSRLGQYLLSAGWDGQIAITNVANGQPLSSHFGIASNTKAEQDQIKFGMITCATIVPDEPQVFESADWVGFRLVLDTSLEFRRAGDK